MPDIPGVVDAVTPAALAIDTRANKNAGFNNIMVLVVLVVLVL